MIDSDEFATQKFDSPDFRKNILLVTEFVPATFSRPAKFTTPFVINISHLKKNTPALNVYAPVKVISAPPLSESVFAP